MSKVDDSRANVVNTLWVFSPSETFASMIIGKPLLGPDSRLSTMSRRAAVEKKSWRRRDKPRNALAPISILPPEILALVFSFHAINQPAARENLPYDIEDPLAPNWIQSQLGWITVTHVCHQWRQVALQHASLWTNVSFSLGDDCAEEMLRRSRTFEESTSLTSRSPPRMRTSSRERALLLDHIYHTQKILLMGSSGLLSPIVKSLTVPAPILETLDLKGSIFRDYTITIPANLFGNHAPALRHLSLDGFRIPWDSPLLTNLTSLELSLSLSEAGGNAIFSFEEITDDEFSKDAMEPTHEQLFAILERMPSLQLLSLDLCLPSAPVPEDLTDRIVQLPCLTRLELVGSVINTFRLVQHLDFPPLTALRIECSNSSVASDNHDLDSLLRSVTQHFHTLDGPAYPVRGLEFSSMLYPPGLRVRTWDTVAHEAFPPSESSAAKLDLTIGWKRSVYPPFADIMRIMRKIMDSLSLDHALRTLIVKEGSTDWKPEHWPSLFGQYRGVIAARASGHAGIALSHALSTPVNTPVNAQQQSSVGSALLLPDLACLSLQHVDFTSRGSTSSKFHKLFPTWLRMRKMTKAGLKKIEVLNCTVKHEWVEEIKDVVSNVIWDHEMGDLEPDSSPEFDYSE
ncbi:hypothetical protein FA95DRAFT_1598858 [Auriscalpium vulgare]|uniref:Uncharacterized protein n=1 Tax=Auriscalpium vulgare TaxID=40419 RepID=A0ACB8RBW1_9AGAM|nr:hypothetical protein FA95DRAFT_1598858 [Auriscalpium vulgare]